MAGVIVSIVNWNGLSYLPACIDSLRRQTFQDFKIVIFDNASTDGSVNWIEKNAPEIDLIKYSRNTGFSFGHNRVINKTESEYFMPMNYDIILGENFLKELILAAESRPDTGMFSGKLFKLIKGEKTNILDSTGITMRQCLQAARGEMEEDRGQYDSPSSSEIFGPCGAAPLYRRKMLDDVRYGDEYFDEDFVYYVEDVDLAWRAQLAGWKGFYCHKAIAYHERGATRKNKGKISRDYLVIGLRNRLGAIYKNLTSGQLKTHFWKIITFELAMILVKHSSYPYSVNVKSVYKFLMLYPKIAKKRKGIQKMAMERKTDLSGFFMFQEYSLWRQIKTRVCDLRSKLRDRITGFLKGALIKISPKLYMKVRDIYRKLRNSGNYIIIGFLKGALTKISPKLYMKVRDIYRKLRNRGNYDVR